MEIVKELNQYCDLTRDRNIVLKKSGVVIGHYCNYGHGPGEHHISKIIEDDRLYELLNKNCKVSGISCSNGPLDESWCKEQYVNALLPGYPVYALSKKGEIVIDVILEKGQISQSYNIGDLIFQLEFAYDGNLNLVSRSKYPQYGKFNVLNFSVGPNKYTTPAIYFKDQRTGLRSVRLGETSMVIHLEMNIDRAVYVKPSILNDFKFVKHKMESFKQSDLRIIPLLKNLKEFCNMNDLDIDLKEEVEKYQLQLNKYDEDINKLREILDPHNIPVPNEMLLKRNEIDILLSEMKTFNYEKLHREVQKWFYDELKKIDLRGKTIKQLLYVLNPKNESFWENSQSACDGVCQLFDI